MIKIKYRISAIYIIAKIINTIIKLINNINKENIIILKQKT